MTVPVAHSGILKVPKAMKFQRSSISNIKLAAQGLKAQRNNRKVNCTSSSINIH